MSTPRVRFAPSPTGFFHIGSARTALFNWLYARHTGATFILRIEDTDKERNTEEYLDIILDGMRWLGMDWDEGPQVGGDYGPYFQSQRSDIYRQYLQILLDKGRAYEKDGAIWFRLEGERHMAEEYSYDGGQNWISSRKTSPDAPEPTIRKVEKVRAEPMVIQDLIRGRVERAEDRDFVIFRSNGEPVFHFVNVVDDIAMKITHVIRGEDHLSNTSKHVELFKAFGAPLPTFAHIPLILKTDGPGKMSKRDRGALIEEYQRRHFLPSAVRNYLCLLGWAPKDGREVMPIEDIIAGFDLKDVHASNARFDERKMAHVNAEHVKQLGIHDYAWIAKPILMEADVIDVAADVDEDYLQAALELCREKVPMLEDLPGFARFFFRDDYAANAEGLASLTKKGDPKARLAELLPALEAVVEWNREGIEQACVAAATASGQKKTAYFPVMRYGVSGEVHGPDLLPMIAVLGRERVLTRLKRFAATFP